MITGKDKKAQERLFEGHSANEKNFVQGYLKEIFQFGKVVFDNIEQGKEISNNDLSSLSTIAKDAEQAYKAGLEQQHPLENGDLMHYVKKRFNNIYDEKLIEERRKLKSPQGKVVEEYVDKKFKEYNKILRERNAEFPASLKKNISALLLDTDVGKIYYSRPMKYINKNYYLIKALDQLILHDERDNEQVVLNLEKGIPDDYKREKFVLDIAPLVVNGDEFVYTAYPERKILDKFTKGKSLTREEEIKVLSEILEKQAEKEGLKTYNAEMVLDTLVNPQSKSTTKDGGKAK